MCNFVPKPPPTPKVIPVQPFGRGVPIPNGKHREPAICYGKRFPKALLRPIHPPTRGGSFRMLHVVWWKREQKKKQSLVYFAVYTPRGDGKGKSIHKRQFERGRCAPPPPPTYAAKGWSKVAVTSLAWYPDHVTIQQHKPPAAVGLGEVGVRCDNN